MNMVTEFADFIQESNRDGSNKAASYLRVLETRPNERYLAEHRELLVAEKG